MTGRAVTKKRCTYPLPQPPSPRILRHTSRPRGKDGKQPTSPYNLLIFGPCSAPARQLEFPKRHRHSLQKGSRKCQTPFVGL